MASRCPTPARAKASRRAGSIPPSLADHQGLKNGGSPGFACRASDLVGDALPKVGQSPPPIPKGGLRPNPNLAKAGPRHDPNAFHGQVAPVIERAGISIGKRRLNRGAETNPIPEDHRRRTAPGENPQAPRRRSCLRASAQLSAIHQETGTEPCRRQHRRDPPRNLYRTGTDPVDDVVGWETRRRPGLNELVAQNHEKGHQDRPRSTGAAEHPPKGRQPPGGADPGRGEPRKAPAQDQARRQGNGQGSKGTGVEGIGHG